MVELLLAGVIVEILNSHTMVYVASGSVYTYAA
jgi:hypothetical protein